MGGKVLLISWNTDFSTAIEGYIGGVFPEWLNEGRVEKYLLPEDFSRNLLEIYESVTDWIETAGGINLLRSIVIVELPLLDSTFLNIKPNPLSTSLQKRFPGVVFASMLVMTFPEVNWLFPGGHQVATPAPHGRELMDHSFSSITLKKELSRKSKNIALFDASGLRDYVRACMKEGEETKKLTKPLPRREALCAAIDDEEAYAFLHGYLAYKLGYRCHLVRTEAEMFEVFKRPADVVQRMSVSFTIEDIFLNFPDRVSEVPHLSDLGERAKAYPGLKGIKHRIFVTAGHKHIEWHEQNQTYINDLKADKSKHIRVVYKPTGGMYNILEKGTLLKEYWQRRAGELAEARPSVLLGGQDSGGHSAPGRLLVIAERLISRAARILKEHRTVQDCIYGASLALEAQELLSYRTPTTSLQAIALRHRLEVTAECLFYGVGYSKDVRNRLQEIEDEVNAVAQWFHPSLRRQSALNAQMIMVTEIIRILREHGQFDEEQQCLNYLRKLYRRSSFWSRPWLGIVYPIRWYVETLVGSFPLFILAMFTWPVLFGFAAWYFSAEFGNGELVSLSDHIEHSFITFFGISPMMFPKGYGQPLAVLIILMGFVHLGIFISHLYTLISRK